jgi:hypothetical protein
VWVRRISLIYCRTKSGSILENLVVTLVVIAVIAAVVINCIYAETEGYVFTKRKQLGGHDNFQKESYNRHKKIS